MKKSIKAKLAAIAVSVLAIAAVTVGTSNVHALGEGQIEGGDIYYSKNLTSGGSFGDPTAAAKCETLQYKVRMHNPGASPVTSVNVKVNLPAGASTQNVSTATITSQNAFPAVTTDTATVNISSSEAISYISGSTELLNASNSVIGGLPDGITGNGVDIGTVGVSINEIRFVQFKAKINCPENPQPAYSCDAFNITADVNRLVRISSFSTTSINGAVFKNATVNWGDGSGDLTDTNIVGNTHQYTKTKDGTYTITATARFTLNGQEVTAGGPQCAKVVTFKGDTPPTVTPPTTPPAPTTLVNTGPGEVAAIFAAIVAAGTLAYRRILSRRLSQQ